MLKKEVFEIYKNFYPVKDIKGILYCDESCNVRKTKLTPSGTNADIKYNFFVLAGLFIEKNNDVNLEDLFNEKFKKPKNAEIKLKFFAGGKNEFLEIAKSERLFTLFNFLKNNNVYIHISIFDYVYSFIIDIFDSLFHDEDFAQFYHSEFKDELYKVLLLEYESLLKLLYKYKFPNISSEDISNFINELLDLYEHCLYENFNDDSIDYFAKETLRQLIKSKRKIKELPFLQENEPFVLEDSLIQQYILKASIFYNMKKYFDNENKIKEELRLLDSDYENTIKMQFIDSKSSLGVQLSDVIAGFVGKLYNYLVMNPITEWITDIITNSHKKQIIENLKLFFELLDKSIEFYELSFITEMPLSLRERLNAYHTIIDKL